MKTRDLIRSLNRAKKDLAKFKAGIPNKDTFITVHCICIDTIKEIQEATKDIQWHLKDARKEDKKNG